MRRIAALLYLACLLQATSVWAQRSGFAFQGSLPPPAAADPRRFQAVPGALPGVPRAVPALPPPLPFTPPGAAPVPFENGSPRPGHRPHWRHGWQRYGGVVIIGPALLQPPAFGEPAFPPPPLPSVRPPAYAERWAAETREDGEAPGRGPPLQAPIWYFCASAAAYFPQVGECPEGWRIFVAPR